MQRLERKGISGMVDDVAGVVDLVLFINLDGQWEANKNC